MNKVIKITFFPKYICNINSYHDISENDFNKLNKIINEEQFFIENFFRISKNLYEQLSSDNLEVQEIFDKNKIQSIKSFLSYHKNDFDLLNLILDYYSDDCDSDISISDNEMKDTSNIIKIFNYNLVNDNENLNKIIESNPHLLDDDTVSECFNN